MNLGSIAGSALNAFGVDMMVRANNIANVNTDGFQAQRLNLMTGPGGTGVQVGSIDRDTSHGPMVPGLVPSNADGSGALVSGYVEGSNTDLGREFVHMIATQRGYEANAKVVSTYDDVSGTLIDMMA